MSYARFLGATILVGLALAGTSPNAFAQSVAIPGECYGSTGTADGGRLIEIDPATGAGTLVGDISGVSAVSGLAIDSAGAIYGTDNLETDSHLYRIDAATGAPTLIGTMGIAGPDGIAFDPNDVLYVSETFGNFGLYTVNLSNAAPTFVTTITGLQLMDEIVGLAFADDGTLYGSAGGGSDRIYTINTTSGAATLVGSTGLGGSTPDLFFDQNGMLFGAKGGGGGTGGGTGGTANTLISIDDATAAGAAIGPLGFVAVSGLACAVPEPGTGAMTAASLSLLFALSRRSRSGLQSELALAA